MFMGTEMSSKTSSSTFSIRLIGILAVACLCAGAIIVVFAAQAYGQVYAGRIFLGLDVHDVSLGGLTIDEAAVALAAEFPSPALLPLRMRDGERTWDRTWADAGIHLDPGTTARLAYQVGRDGSMIEQWTTRLQSLVFGYSLSPVVVLPDPAEARTALEALNQEVAIPPVNATLYIQPEAVIPVPGKAGQELDIEAIIASLPYAVGVGSKGLVMELLTRPVDPPIPDPRAAQTQAETLLAQPFTLATDDPLTDFEGTWSVEPAILADWLMVQPIVAVDPIQSDGSEDNDPDNPDQDGARLILTVREEAVRAYLDTLGSQLTDQVAINVEKTIPVIREAVEAGQLWAEVALIHQAHTYIVQPGDTLMSVAHAHGFPVWRLTEANPQIEPGELWPDQQIVIPSVDVLFPLPVTTERRIVVDISEQHLTVYEGDTPVYGFRASTGIASSPTIPGVFQILSKEKEAYASSWDLWMPHFMGIYRTGPDFTNGIHGLPTLSNGTRLWEGYLGSPVSYGCVVIGLSEAAQLYDWTELGTLVVIQE
jgi:lipoprotein-anchoring transpeptidase ErfK/SrfK